MKLNILGIRDEGDLERERLILQANEDTDIGGYVVLCGRATKDNNAQAGRVPDAYWFIDQEVSRGDLIILYSKTGRRSEKKNDDGGTSYFFYWNKSETLWRYKKTLAVVLEAPNWRIARPVPDSSVDQEAEQG